MANLFKRLELRQALKVIKHRRWWMWFINFPGEGQDRITETGETRLTETSEVRLTQTG